MFSFTVPDMTCSACVRRLTNAIQNIDPAAEVTVTTPAGRHEGHR